MFRFKFAVVLGLAFTLGRSSIASTNFTENFSSSPFGVWSFGIGDNSNNQFTWTNTPAIYTEDSNGELDVHLNSSLPTARFQRPLGVTLTDTNDFTVTAQFSFHLISNPEEQAIQIAFGLVNSTLTGGDRTGTEDDEGDFLATDNAFDTVEFNYFPSISPDFEFSGPTLTPVVIGAQDGGDDSFGNFAGIFDAESDLGDDTNGITALPQDVTLQATLTYYGGTKTLILAVSQVNSNGSITPLDTGLPPMNLVASGYVTNFPFNVDTLAIMAYHDGFTTTNNPSLIADLRFQRLYFTTSAPPPPSNVFTKVSGTNVSLVFPTISTNFYDIQSSTDLVSGSWSTIASNIVGTGGIVTNIDVGGATVSHRFYRVGVQVN